MILMMMHQTALRLLARRSTEPRGASFVLFLFGVSMPKGERAIRSRELHGWLFAVGLSNLLVFLVYLLALSSALWTYSML